MRRARIKIAPSLPARRAPSASAKPAAASKVPIDEPKKELKEENDEKIVLVEQSSAPAEVQAITLNDETELKVEKTSPTKQIKPTCAPSLPARRAPSAASKILINELENKNAESSAPVEIQVLIEETDLKIEKASPTKQIKPTCDTQEVVQVKKIEVPDQGTFKTPEVQRKSIEDRLETITSDVTQPVVASLARPRSRVKIMPHLKIARNLPSAKITTSMDPPNPDPHENITVPAFEDSAKEIRPETPIFTSLNGMASPPPYNNLQPPASPANPFVLPYPHPHPRIRTESLCSIKSNFSAYKDMGAVVRKNFRSEETQRIIDTKRESRVRLSNKNLDKTQLRMFDMIYWNPTSSPMKPPVHGGDSKRMERSKSVTSIASLEADDEDLDRPATFVVPQLMLGPNGEMILDEKSLVIENEQQKQNRILLANSNVIYDDELSGNYGYYKRQKRTRDWSAEETVKFYRCLQTVGTDFSLMVELFTDTNRTRRDLKLKFKKEEKSNMALINKAMMHPNSFDIDELKQELQAEENVKKLAAENKAKNEVHERLKKEILKKHEAKKAKISSQKRKASQVELILKEQPIEETHSLPATSDTKENQVQVRTSKRRKVKDEPIPVQLNKVSVKEKKVKSENNVQAMQMVVDDVPDKEITVKEQPMKEPVIQEIISRKTEEILDLDANKQPSPVKKTAADKLPAFNFIKSPPHSAFETFVDQMGNRFECELRDVAEPPLVIEYTGDTFIKIDLSKDQKDNQVDEKSGDNFKISLRESCEKREWTPEVDYSKISVADLQVVMDVDEINKAVPQKDTTLGYQLTKKILNSSLDEIEDPIIDEETFQDNFEIKVEAQCSVESSGSKMVVDEEENFASTSTLPGVDKIGETRATFNCDPPTPTITPKKEINTQPAIFIEANQEFIQNHENPYETEMEKQNLNAPVYLEVPDNNYCQPKFELKEAPNDVDEFADEPEMQINYGPEQNVNEQYQEFYNEPNPYYEEEPEPEVEEESEDPAILDAISEFVNNFDLSSLVLIETEVNGKVVKEVHTMDPETEEVSSEPIDCPAAIKEYLIKNMQSGEETEEEDDE